MSTNIQIIQNRLLTMGNTIADILDNNNIPYMITFGTLLGAVRHGGFIPWDDDFDLCLFSDSYQAALTALEDNLPDNMFVEYFDSEPKYFHNWAHVKDTNSIANCTLFPHDNIYSHKGLSIDLYCATRMDTINLNSFLRDEKMKYLSRRHANGTLSEEQFLSISQCSDSPEEDLLSICNSEVFGMPLPEKYMEIDDVLPLKKYDFSGTKFYGPNNAHKILKQFYGNYQELPPVEKRIPHYDSVTFL